METMELMDPMSPAEGEELLNDEVEDLSNSLREVVQDGAVKPKLHCLMMDPSFSMVTVQSEDSGIVWETASSRCSTPWASEFSAPVSEPSFSLRTPGSAGRIMFIMDEALMSRRKRKKRSEKSKTLPQVSQEILAEADRPAMVEVSTPNLTLAEGSEELKTADQKEERHQQLFSLVSEGSEILNIIAPPKVSTVDEEESRALEDNLYYLEETPAVKSAEILEDPDLEAHPEAEEMEKSHSVIPEPSVPLPHIQVSRRGATNEDYFEKFTLLDSQASSGAAPVEEVQPETADKATSEEQEDKAPPPAGEPLSGVSSAVSMLDISGEHLDDVFYGGGGEPPGHDTATSGRGREPSKSSLKESGSALFGSEESILTPIYLPEGPPKIIDQNLLEEPKALAFLYSDLYADAIGTRQKREDDIESVTSEKSFHSQQSDSEDRGYLEKFVLKVETVATEGQLKPEVRHEEPQEPFRLAGYVEHHREVENPGEEQEEVTDFFRNSASSSPCEPADFERLEREEEPEVIRTPRVTFKDEPPKTSDHQPFTDDTDFSEEFLPVEITEDCPAWEENLPVVRAAVKPASTRTDEVKHNAASGSDKSSPTPTQAHSTSKPIIPPHKPFLDLSALMPVETEDEKDSTEKENTSSDGPAEGSDQQVKDSSLSEDVKD